MKRIVLTIVFALLLATSAFAQNATVTGTVTDVTGALIPAVEVTASNVNTGIATVQITNETGTYLFASLQPGAYRLTAALPGFQTTTLQNVQLSQGQQVRLNFSLEVAAVGQTIEVTTDADAALATSSSSVGDVLPDIEVRSLPLAVRDVTALISATAGTAGSDGRNFGGMGTRELALTRDGLNVNDVRYGSPAQAGTFVSSDLVEEVQVVVGSIDAESGRGSGQVRLQTRSGTNEFHGALFYMNNNSALNAQNWFEKLGKSDKSYVNRNQFGGRIGGPIIRNKLFFFVLVDNQRYVTKENFVAQVLTDQARQGIFRYIPGRLNGNALSGTRSVDLQGTPQGSVSSFNLFSDVRDPNRTQMTSVPYWRDILTKHMPPVNDYTVGDGLNLAGHRWLRRTDGLAGGNNVGNENNRDQLNVRFDYHINDRNRVSYVTSREEDWGERVNDWPTGSSGIDSYYPHVTTTSWTSTLSNTLLNEFRFGRKQSSFYRNSPFELGCCRSNTEQHTERSEEAQELFDQLPQVNGLPMYITTAATNAGFGNRPTLPASVYVNQGFDTTRGNKNPTIQISDTLSWTRNSHAFKTGFEFVRNWSDGWNTTAEQFPKAVIGQGPTPVQGISSARFAGLQAADATRAAEILNDLAGSLRGVTQGFIINKATQTEWDTYATESRRFRKLTQNDWSVFFKDTWNVTGNLTMNLGVRYDKYGVMYEGNGLLPNGKGRDTAAFGISGSDFNAMWNPNATAGQLSAIELVGKHSPHPDTLFYPNDWNNVAPSIGFSYNVPWIGRPTVVRGGYGINYAGLPVMLDYELAFLNTPGSVSVEAQAISQFGYNYLSLDQAVANKVLPLTPSFQPNPSGDVILPLDSRSQTFNSMSNSRATPYIQSFNLSIQHEIMPQLTLQVSYIGNKATKLYSNIEVNETNIFENGLLEAFNVTRAGGDHPLFDRIMAGLNVPGAGRVDGVSLTGSQALRLYATTDNWLADGNIGALADFLNRNSAITRSPGGFLRNGNLPENFIVVNPQFRYAELWGTDRNSAYHSMQTQLRKQMSHGFSGQVTYTFAKGLSDGINSNVRGATNVLDPRNRSANRSRVGFDRTHAFVGHATWDLPFGPGRTILGGAPGWVHRLVEGWQLATIFNYATGAPLNITSPNGTMGGARITSVPDVVGNLPKSAGQVKVGDGFVTAFDGLSSVRASLPNFGSDPANLAADFGNRNIVDSNGNVVLTNPEPGKVGTLGLGYLQGPPQLGFDLGLSKTVRMSERTTFTLRADAVNVLNKPQWGDPSGGNLNINSVNFGRITSADGERTITINARVDF